ncbi:MAG: hypothetical protein C0404_08825 [Verrucomicrobia bacterium]|nr:hypothetical protein [Verrucomicrobiota bacterium]
MTPSILVDCIVVLMIAIIVAHSLVLKRQGRWMAFDPLVFFWIGVFVVYMLQPVANIEKLVAWHSIELLELTFLYILLAVICVIIGYESRLGIRLVSVIPGAPARLDGQKVIAACLLSVAVGFLGYLHLFGSSGGLGKWLSVARGGTNYDATFGYIAQLKVFFDGGVVFLLLCSLLFPLSRLARGAIWTFGILIIAWYLYLGSRSMFILLSLSVLSAFYLPKRTNPSLLLLGVVFFVVFTVVNFQGLYRDRFINLSFNVTTTEMVSSSALAVTVLDMERDNPQSQRKYNQGGEFNVMMNTIKYVPDEVPYHYGYNYLELFTRLVPRAWWPEKRYPGLEAFQGVLQRLGGGAPARVRRTNLIMGPAFTFVGYWYYLGGYVALVLAAIGTGVLFRLVRGLFDRAPGNQGDVILYSQLYLFGFGEAATTPTGWLYSLPFTMLFLLLVFRFCKAKPEIPIGEGEKSLATAWVES